MLQKTNRHIRNRLPAGLLLLSITGFGALLSSHAETPLPDTPLPATPLSATPLSDPSGDPLPSGAIMRYGTLRLQHPRHAWQAALSPDKKLLASADGLNRLLLWDAATGKQLWATAPARQQLGAIVFSPDAKTLVVLGLDAPATLFDVATGKNSGKIGDDQTGWVSTALFLPSGQLLTVGKKLCLWDLSTKKMTAELTGFEKALKVAALSSDGQLLAAGGVDPDVYVWNLSTSTILAKLKRDADLTALSFSPDGKFLAIGDRGTITDTMNKERTAIIKQEQADPKTLLWEIASQKESRRFEKMSFPHFTADHLWGAKPINRSPNWQLVDINPQTWTRQDTALNCGHRWTFSSDGALLAALTGVSGLQLRHLPDGKPALSLPGPTSAVGALAISPDGLQLVTAFGNASVPWPSSNSARIWNLKTGQPLPGLDDSVGILSAAYSPDGAKLAAACSDGTVRLYDPATSKETARTSVMKPPVEPPPATRPARDPKPPEPAPQQRPGIVAWSGDKIIIATLDGRVLTWDGVAVAQPLPIDLGPRRFLLHLATPQKGQILALAKSPLAAIFDAHSGKILTELKHPDNDFIMALAISADGTTVACASATHVFVWATATGKEIARIKMPPDHAGYGLALSPDGKFLATGGRKDASGKTDSTVRLWRISDGQELAKFSGHDASVNTLIFTPDARSLISGSEDCTALRWNIPTPLPEK